MANVNKAKEAAQKAAQSLGLAQARVILAEAAEAKKESKKRNTRLVNIGIVIEQQMKSDPTLLSRVESGVLTAFGDRKAVLEAFGLEGDGENWFQQLRRESAAAAQAKSGGTASASISGDSSSGSAKGSSAAKDASPASKPGASPAASGNGTSPSKPSTNGTGAHPSAS